MTDLSGDERILGIVGGTGPESTVDYYRSLVATWRRRRPDGSYPRVIINSIEAGRVFGNLSAADFGAVGRDLARAAMALAITVAFAMTAHAAAPVVRAACDGGSTYDTAVAHAHGAFVGVIAETREDGLGFVYASAVTVERAFGVRVGPIFHGRADVGLCADDFPRVGDAEHLGGLLDEIARAGGHTAEL